MKSEMSVQPHPDSGKSTTSQVAPGSPFPMLMLPQDDRLTFLLPRPVWVNDLDVTHCTACDAAFGPLRRRASIYGFQTRKTHAKVTHAYYLVSITADTGELVAFNKQCLCMRTMY